MVEQHRRVESRSIIGTGMATDPDRVRDIERRAARMERDYGATGVKFGEVVSGKPHGLEGSLEWVDAPVEKEHRARPGSSGAPPDAAASPPPEGQEDPKAEAEAKKAAAQAPRHTAPPPSGPGAIRSTPRGPKSAPPKERARPVQGAGNAGMAQQLGRSSKVTFKV